MSGLIGDAEKIKFVFGEDTLEKCRMRIDMLEQGKGLPGQTRLQIVMTLYNLERDEVQMEIESYINENLPHLSDAIMSKKFNVWWMGIIAREKRDMALAIKKLGG